MFPKKVNIKTAAFFSLTRSSIFWPLNKRAKDLLLMVINQRSCINNHNDQEWKYQQ